MLWSAAGIAWMYNCWPPYAWEVAPADWVPARLNGGGVPEWNDCFSYDCLVFNHEKKCEEFDELIMPAYYECKQGGD